MTVIEGAVGMLGVFVGSGITAGTLVTTAGGGKVTVIEEPGDCGADRGGLLMAGGALLMGIGAVLGIGWGVTYSSSSESSSSSVSIEKEFDVDRVLGGAGNFDGDTVRLRAMVMKPSLSGVGVTAGAFASLSAGRSIGSSSAKS
jgi:hypothetical protein